MIIYIYIKDIVIYSFVIHIDFYLEQDGDHWC